MLNIDSKLENALAFYEGKIVTDEGTTLREEIEEAMVAISLNSLMDTELSEGVRSLPKGANIGVHRQQSC